MMLHRRDLVSTVVAHDTPPLWLGIHRRGLVHFIQGGDSLFDLGSSDLSVVVSISDVKRPSEFSERSANFVIETFAEPAANW